MIGTAAMRRFRFVIVLHFEHFVHRLEKISGRDLVVMKYLGKDIFGR